MLVSTLYKFLCFQCFLIFKCIFEAFRGISGSSFAWEGICKIFWTNQISTPECRELTGTYSIWGFKIVVLLYSEHFQPKGTRIGGTLIGGYPNRGYLNWRVPENLGLLVPDQGVPKFLGIMGTRSTGTQMGVPKFFRIMGTRSTGTQIGYPNIFLSLGTRSTGTQMGVPKFSPDYGYPIKGYPNGGTQIVWGFWVPDQGTPTTFSNPVPQGGWREAL